MCPEFRAAKEKPQLLHPHTLYISLLHTFTSADSFLWICSGSWISDLIAKNKSSCRNISLEVVGEETCSHMATGSMKIRVTWAEVKACF